MVTPMSSTAPRLALAFDAVARAAELCAARPQCVQAREVFRLVLAKLENEKDPLALGPRLAWTRP